MKRVIVVIAISIVSEVAVAQWRFTPSLNASGCGNSLDDKIAWRAAEAQVNNWLNQGINFRSKVECEQSRQVVMGYSNNYGNCKIRFIASPCVGSGGTMGNVDVLGVSKGSSFNSTNPVNEINDWSNDDMERMLALNPEYDTKMPETVATGDNDFDRIIESMPYGNEAFSGRMPKGSTHIKADDNITVIGQPVKGNGVHVPDDFTSTPFDGLEERHSADLNSVNIELKPIKNTGYKEDGAIQKTLRTIDEKMNWYQAEDGNTLQYIYTKGKENIQNIGDWWNNSNISSRISNTLNTITDVIKDDGVSAGVKMLFKPEYQNVAEDAYNIHSTLAGSVKEAFEKIDAKTIVDKAAKGETMDMSPISNKIRDDINGLAVEVSRIPNPPKDYWDNTRNRLEKNVVKKIDFNNIISE